MTRGQKLPIAPTQESSLFVWGRGLVLQLHPPPLLTGQGPTRALQQLLQVLIIQLEEEIHSFVRLVRLTSDALVAATRRVFCRHVRQFRYQQLQIFKT
ncbi:hypothetical protein I3843_13G078800 [Carya illinoinensis]|nr:hypothetical protein I3843_13G078800 [Carya illinoinensis]